MISWGTIIYGAAVSAAAAALVVFALHRRRPSIAVSAALSAAAGAVIWNAILHHLHANEFFVDAPVSIMPASWQDAGSGVFTIATAAVGLGFGAARNDSGRSLALIASLCGLASFLVDVYLY
jgi:hypothetical protein